MSRFTLLAESGPVSLDLTLFGHTATVLEPAFAMISAPCS